MMAEVWSLASALTSGAHSRTAREIVPRSGAILSAPRKRSRACAMLVRASLVLTGWFLLSTGAPTPHAGKHVRHCADRAHIARHGSIDAASCRPRAGGGRDHTALLDVARGQLPNKISR